MPRNSKRDQLLPEIIRLNKEGRPLGEAAAEVGVHPVTVGKWLRQTGRQDEVTRHYGRTKDPSNKIEIVCDHCRETFSVFRSQRRRFCSRKCNNDWQRDNARAYVRHCEGCGGKVSPPAKGYSYRKYCSPECRSEHAPRRQKDPDKWGTYTCETCGEEFVRLKANRNAKKFCSNDCARRHTRTTRHYVLRDSDVVLDSAWEGLFYCTVTFLGTPVERFDRSQAISWGEDRTYGPDFYLPALNLYVEVKGVEDPEDQERWSAFRDQVGPLAVLRREDLDALRRADRDGAVDLLGRAALSL